MPRTCKQHRPDCKSTGLFFFQTDRKSCELLHWSEVVYDDRRKVYTQRKVCVCRTASASVKKRQTSFSIPAKCEIYTQKHAHTHTPGCSCNPNCSSAKSSARPHKHCLTTLEAELLCDCSSTLHTHHWNIIYCCFTHFAHTQTIMVAVACFIRPAGLVFPAQSYVQNSFHPAYPTGNIYKEFCHNFSFL